MTMETIAQQSWYATLDKRVQNLVQQTVILVDLEQEHTKNKKIVDYGYLVFSAAKAYEGFLKHYFYTMGFINEGVLDDDHFRIGKALNPGLPKRYRDEDWLFDEVSEVCGEKLALFLWSAWKQGRNMVFHFHNQQPNGMKYEQAVARVELIFEAIQKAQDCEVKYKDREN